MMYEDDSDDLYDDHHDDEYGGLPYDVDMDDPYYDEWDSDELEYHFWGI